MYGTFVTEARRARGLSQTQLAEISGVAQANISAIERGHRVPSASTLHRLLHACGFELTASAGSRILFCPPPEGSDTVGVLDRSPYDEPPAITRETPMKKRVEAITAVLDLAEAIVRSR